VSRRGTVSVRDATGAWSLLSVYDDGWCTVPAAVPTAEDTRRRLREVLGWMGTIAGLLAAAVVAEVVVGVPWLAWLLFTGWVGALVLLGVLVARRRARNRPPVFGSSAEQAAAVDGARRTPLDLVRGVAVQRVGHEDVVTVTLRRGAPLVYRSPDRTLRRLFQPWSPAPPG
jgi:hypothetical protein